MIRTLTKSVLGSSHGFGSVSSRTIVHQAKVWTAKRKVIGAPKLDDFACVEEQLPQCQDGEIIIEAKVLSVDPYNRIFLQQGNAGMTMPGGQVAKVLESKCRKFEKGDLIVGYPGWRSHSRITKQELQETAYLANYVKLPDLGSVPITTAIGTLGMPGLTAYYGLLKLCDPKPGDVVVVNAAAGAVGSVVCQLAKIKGCKVIAFVGSDSKFAILKEFGVDHVFNYKKVNVYDELKAVVPNGINSYFDNVGGEFTANVIPLMAKFGRIAVCGAISTYNDGSKDIGRIRLNSPFGEVQLILNEIRVEGFTGGRWADEWGSGIAEMRQWIEEGKLKHMEAVYKGFENMPEAFLSLFSGDNIGKVVVTP